MWSSRSYAVINTLINGSELTGQLLHQFMCQTLGREVLTRPCLLAGSQVI
jgi:hypothetical protein